MHSAVSSDPMSKTRVERSKRWSKKDERLLLASALLLGFNQLATDADVLGTKVFYRLHRDKARKLFTKLGGTIDEQTEPRTLTLRTRPELKFYEKDIEAMRALVADHDAKKGKS